MDQQLGMFGDAQPDMFGDEPTRDWTPQPDKVRAKLHALLDQMRSADSVPWTPRKTAHNRTVFPQMCFWLPEEEATQLRMEFDRELERLSTVA